MRPQDDLGWVTAKRESPSRAPYTDEELRNLRIVYRPDGPLKVDAREATSIWTLLDMIEKEKGWSE